jgi:membrane associated rhomboid family serine protease
VRRATEYTDGFSFGGFQLTPVVKKLLIANVAVAIVTGLLLPDAWVYEWLAFRPDHVLTRPWGALTYMFVHAGLIHLVMNMLVLFFFGPPLEDRWGGREFLQYYLVCGLGGVLLSFLLAPDAPIVGASAACYGLMLAFALAWPDAPIMVYAIFPVKAKYVVGFFFLISFLGASRNPGGAIAHMAHLGGLLTGLVYLKADRLRPREQLAALKQRSTRVRRLAIVPRDEETPPPPARPTAWRTADEGALLDAVDRVLDKISAHGMSSLTPEERGLLDEVSRRSRTHK